MVSTQKAVASCDKCRKLNFNDDFAVLTKLIIFLRQNITARRELHVTSRQRSWTLIINGLFSFISVALLPWNFSLITLRSCRCTFMQYWWFKLGNKDTRRLRGWSNINWATIFKVIFFGVITHKTSFRRDFSVEQSSVLVM